MIRKTFDALVSADYDINNFT